jgi:hypothetical protein
MAVNLFVYGPLMLRDVIKEVVGRELSRRDGTVNGYMQLRLKEQSQAALIPFPDAITEGVVYTDVDEELLRRMDVYLGKMFERGEVNVQVGENEWMDAETHFFKLSKKKELSAVPWDEEEFQEKGPKKVGTQKSESRRRGTHPRPLQGGEQKE